jgi:hypothetical protein
MSEVGMATLMFAVLLVAAVGILVGRDRSADDASAGRMAPQPKRGGGT